LKKVNFKLVDSQICVYAFFYMDYHTANISKLGG
jgi:hypothetical protein